MKTIEKIRESFRLIGRIMFAHYMAWLMSWFIHHIVRASQCPFWKAGGDGMPVIGSDIMGIVILISQQKTGLKSFPVKRESCSLKEALGIRFVKRDKMAQLAGILQ